jgi:hypothetical protein
MPPSYEAAVRAAFDGSGIREWVDWKPSIIE